MLDDSESDLETDSLITRMSFKCSYTGLEHFVYCCAVLGRSVVFGGRR